MSNTRFLAAAVLASLSLPSFAHAAVVINEIAWMGSSENANAEWIELYNDGAETISLTGWTITSSGTAPNITMVSGKTIPAGGFFLLERTSDASAAPSADQIYTGALSNGGDTLTLKDQTGATLDQVVGGTNWSSIGGDNTTKQTPQRNGSSWITATPTPKATNATSGSAATTTPTTEPTATTTPVVTIGGTAPSTTAVASPVQALYMDAGPDRIIPAHMPTPFHAFPYTKGGNWNKNAAVTWNFGDGARATGEKVTHTYKHPAEYVVTVRARDGEANVLKTVKVVVEEYAVTAQTTEDGIAVTNTSSKLVDLSFWKLTAEDVVFEIPEDTALWPGAKVIFTSDVTGLPGGVEAVLTYPDGKEAVTTEVVEEVVEEAAAPIIEEVTESMVAPQLPPPQPQLQEVQTAPLPAPVIEEPIYEEDGVEAPAAPNLQAAVGAAVPPVSIKPSWLLCLFGSLFACSAAFAVP